MKFLRILKWLKEIRPRYTLSLENKIFNDQKRATDYRFKTFGEHAFPIFSYKDIISHKQILFGIYPLDLIEIAIIEKKQSDLKNIFFISECIRNNNYRIKNYFSEKVLSGREICNTPILLEQINSLDVYKIAYNTGFLEGRKFSQQLIEPDKKIENTVKKLQLVHNVSDTGTKI